MMKFNYILTIRQIIVSYIMVRSVMVSDFRSETKSARFKSGC